MVTKAEPSAMKVVLSALLMACGLLLGPAAMACEKHLDGHQNSGDTQAEVQKR